MTATRIFIPRLLVLCLVWLPAAAHHSGADVDLTRVVSIAGTVKEFVWANPHCWLYVLVPNDHGGTDEWAVESGAVMIMARTGMRSKSFKQGDKVEVKLSPRKDGRLGGSMKYVKLLETGQEFETGTQVPSPPAG
jgi:hypothetical protein